MAMVKAPFFLRFFQALTLQRSLYREAAENPSFWREATATVLFAALLELYRIIYVEGPLALLFGLLYGVFCWFAATAISYLVLRLLRAPTDLKALLRCIGMATAPVALRVLVPFDPTNISVTFIVGVWLLVTYTVAFQVVTNVSWTRATAASLLVRTIALILMFFGIVIM